MKPLNAEPKRNDSVVPFAAAAVAPGKDFVCFSFILSFNYGFLLVDFDLTENCFKFAEVDEKEKVEAVDYEQLVKDLENASPLEIMDKALEKFGNDIAIAFR